MSKERDDTPSFTLSSKAVRLVADIAALTERFALRMEQPDTLLLRRAILCLISADASVTSSGMARQLGVSRQTIAKAIASLKHHHRRRIGPR